MPDLGQRNRVEGASGNVAGVVTCTLAVGALPAGASGSVAFGVTVDPDLGAEVQAITNTASVHDDGTNGADPTPEDDRASVSTPVEASGGPPPAAKPELDVTLRDALAGDLDGSGSFSAGDRVTYRVAVRNSGSAAAGQLVFRVPVPKHTAFLDGSVSGGDVVESSLSGHVLSVWLHDLAAGGTLSFTWDVGIDSPLAPGVRAVEAQGAVTALGVDTVPSDDPDTAVVDDPTVTPLDGGDGTGGPRPIPTLSELGLLVLGLLLAFGAWRALS